MKIDEVNPVDSRLKALMNAAYPDVEVSEELRQRVQGRIAQESLHARQRRQVRFRVKAGFAFGAAALLTGAVITLLPRIAGAEELYRMQHAIRDVRSAHLVEWQIKPDGSRVLGNEIWYQNGNWRRVDTGGQWITVVNGGNRWVYQALENTVTLDRGTAPAGMEGVTGFTVAAGTHDDSLNGVIDDVRDSGSTIVKGRTARLLTIRDNKYPDFRSLVAVDATTDLPLNGESQRFQSGEWVTVGYSASEFNTQLPATLFQPDFPKAARLINQITGRDYWQRRLQTGIAVVRLGKLSNAWKTVEINGQRQLAMMGVNQPTNVTLHDFECNQNGDVFALFTDDFPLNSEGVQSGDVTLTDDHGTSYVCAQNVAPLIPSSIEQDGSVSGITVGKPGENLNGMWWVPVEPITAYTPRVYMLTIKAISLDVVKRPKAIFHVQISKPAVAYLPDYMPYMARPLGADYWIPIYECLTRAYYNKTMTRNLPVALADYEQAIALQDKLSATTGMDYNDNQTYYAVYQIQAQLGHPQEAKAALLRANINNDYAGPTHDAILAAMAKEGLKP